MAIPWQAKRLFEHSVFSRQLLWLQTIDRLARFHPKFTGCVRMRGWLRAESISNWVNFNRRRAWQ